MRIIGAVILHVTRAPTDAFEISYPRKTEGWAMNSATQFITGELRLITPPPGGGIIGEDKKPGGD